MNLLKEKIDTYIERRQAIFNLPSFSKKQIQKSYIWFNYNVYKGYRSRIKLILNAIIILLRSNSFIILILSKFFNSHFISKLKKYIITFYFK